MSAVGEGPQSKLIDTWRGFIAPAPLVALAWSLTQIAFFFWPTVSTLAQRASHVSFALVLALLLTGAHFRHTAWRVANFVLAFLAALPGVYVMLSVDRLMNERIAGVDAPLFWDYVFGLLLVVLIAEASRRVLGAGITLLAGVFVAYNFAGPWIPGGLGHRYGGLGQFIDAQFLNLSGIYGVPTGVSAHVVFYFILFAAVFDVFGGGRMIIELAMALTGRRIGGPAKAAVVASGMMGSVSGSAVANVMSTGIFTIPLMKRVGYTPRFAASVEAVASTGGQLVPPVMGAAAFVMADMLQTPYSDIAIAAIIPSILYYAALIFVVDLQARKLGLRSVDAADLPRLGTTLRERGHMLIPLIWLCYQVVAGYPVDQAAMQGAGLTVLLGMSRRATRAAPIAIVRAVQVSAERTISVALPCALAGIIVAVIAYSGLGTKFTSLMVLLSGGWLPAMLVLAALGALILGCGMPTTSAYIMAAVLIAPALVLLNVEPLVAHFFIFYFAILSMVTPPVALASYAAAAIAGAPANETGWKAFMLALPGFVIPFAIVVHPGLLMTGDAGDAAWGFFNVLVGFVALAASITGFLFRSLSPRWRAWFAVIGIANVLPGVAVSVATLGLLVGSAAWLRREARRGTRAGVRAT
ncbi:MAG TPA: TRAP transporter fused permease subunit [Burkholderiales bacterium]